MKGNESKDPMQEKEGSMLVVIGRQYGSGGRRIGKMLAQRLGISYYDKSLLSHAAERLGYSPEIFRRKDERRPSMLRSLLSFNYGTSSPSDPHDAPMSDEQIYNSQSRVIREICEAESCVIVGRTADYVMRDHPRMASIFIHAPLDYRIDALMARGEAADRKSAADLVQRNDRNRASYYNYYTNSNAWGRAENYHLSLDASRLDDETIAAVVSSLLNTGKHPR